MGHLQVVLGKIEITLACEFHKQLRDMGITLQYVRILYREVEEVRDRRNEYLLTTSEGKLTQQEKKHALLSG